jgi:hypothetical protein
MAKKKDAPKTVTSEDKGVKEIDFDNLTRVQEGNEENAIKELEAAFEFLGETGDKETQVIIGKILKMIKDK